MTGIFVSEVDSRCIWDIFHDTYWNWLRRDDATDCDTLFLYWKNAGKCLRDIYYIYIHIDGAFLFIWGSIYTLNNMQILLNFIVNNQNKIITFTPLFKFILINAHFQYQPAFLYFCHYFFSLRYFFFGIKGFHTWNFKNWQICLH